MFLKKIIRKFHQKNVSKMRSDIRSTKFHVTNLPNPPSPFVGGQTNVHRGSQTEIKMKT